MLKCRAAVQISLSDMSIYYVQFVEQMIVDSSCHQNTLAVYSIHSWASLFAAVMRCSSERVVWNRYMRGSDESFPLHRSVHKLNPSSVGLLSSQRNKPLVRVVGTADK